MRLKPILLGAVLVLLLSIAAVAAVRMYRSVEYYGAFIYIDDLKQQVATYHCVEVTDSTRSAWLRYLIPHFRCFNTITEADTFILSQASKP